MHNWNGAVTLKTKVKGTVEREKKEKTPNCKCPTLGNDGLNTTTTKEEKTACFLVGEYSKKVHRLLYHPPWPLLLPL